MRAFVIAVVALFGAATASAQEAAATSAGGKMGLTGGLRLTYASPTEFIPKEGDKQKFSDFDASASSMVINVNLGYDFASMVPGLYAGVDVPIVQNKQDFGGEQNNFGLGDVSLYGGYLAAVNEQLKAGGQLRLKLATGKYKELEADQTALGSGSMNIQVNGAVRGNFTGVTLAADVGYLMTMENSDSKINPGDIIFADIAGGYQVNEMIEPRLHILFGMAGNPSFDGTAAKDQEQQWLALAVDVQIKINEMLGAYVGWGTSLEGLGLNLPYGYVVSGKNVFNGFVGVTAGVNGSF